VIDNSVPGYDLGYRRTYIDKAQIQKVGLAFSSDTDPAYFEFYTRNYKGEITSYIFAKTVDAPVYKIVYNYDNTGNISEFQLFQPVTLTVANMQNIMIDQQQKRDKLSSSKFNYGLHKKFENLQKIIADNKHYSSPVISDNSIEYRLYLTAKVVTDGRINPYSQQDQILFYQTNRSSFAYDPTPFFLSLLKSNPVKIEYSVPDFGSILPVQTFSYTYNAKGYPVTIHEEFSDPNWAFLGDYTGDSQIEYANE